MAHMTSGISVRRQPHGTLDRPESPGGPVLSGGRHKISMLRNLLAGKTVLLCRDEDRKLEKMKLEEAIERLEDGTGG